MNIMFFLVAINFIYYIDILYFYMKDSNLLIVILNKYFRVINYIKYLKKYQFIVYLVFQILKILKIY